MELPVAVGGNFFFEGGANSSTTSPPSGRFQSTYLIYGGQRFSQRFVISDSFKFGTIIIQKFRYTTNFRKIKIRLNFNSEQKEPHMSIVTQLGGLLTQCSTPRAPPVF